MWGLMSFGVFAGEHVPFNVFLPYLPPLVSQSSSINHTPGRVMEARRRKRLLQRNLLSGIPEEGTEQFAL